MDTTTTVGEIYMTQTGDVKLLTKPIHEMLTEIQKIYS